ncbi:MAG TPA: ABC transporter ATP-binding protein [Blastococcus sp.]|jgi:ABC-type Fe3+/spermidine/putrescine transport system ATPase subunit|nr:ABC transporter ATP-binding protein [Blastococcus sp.]
MTAVRGHRLVVDDATKTFGSVTALEQVSFEVEPGEFLVLLGPSGSGKSTLIRALAGIERLDAGSIGMSGQSISGPRLHVPSEKRDLAMVFQDYALWPHMTVRDNVGYALRRRRLPRPAHAARVREVLQRVGLERHLDRYPSQLSGGEQQRVALARAIVAEPGLLLFDEPLSNLDADLRERLRVQIATLTRECGATAVYITHDQAEAFALADRIGVLDQGRLVQLATPEQLYRSPGTPFVARFTGAAGELTGHAVAADGDAVRVQIGEDCLLGRPIGPVRAGAHTTLLIRPDATSLVDGDLDARGRDGAPGGGSLRGQVLDVAYRGRAYDHLIACAAGTLTAVRAARPRGRGEWVQIRLDPDGCLAYAGSDRDERNITAVMIDNERERELVVGSARGNR